MIALAILIYIGKAVYFIVSVFCGTLTTLFGMIYFITFHVTLHPNQDWSNLFTSIPEDRKWMVAFAFVFCGMITLMRELIKFFVFLKSRNVR